jgi:hypothetical protein
MKQEPSSNCGRWRARSLPFGANVVGNFVEHHAHSLRDHGAVAGCARLRRVPGQARFRFPLRVVPTSATAAFSSQTVAKQRPFHAIHLLHYLLILLALDFPSRIIEIVLDLQGIVCEWPPRAFSRSKTSAERGAIWNCGIPCV